MKAIQAKKQRDLTQGSIPAGILAFAFPLFLGQMLQQFYNLADAWVIGNFASNDSFAAVSSAGNLIFLIIGFFSGTAVGGGVVISRYFGARDAVGVKQAIHSNFLFGIIASAFTTVISLLLIPTLLVHMNTPESVLPYSLQYFRIYCSGVFTVVIYNICTSTMQALGDSLHPLLFLFISSMTNVVLDLLFVAGFRWDVAGAAIATVLSQALSAFLSIRHLSRLEDESIRLEWKHLRWNQTILGQIIRQGLPTGVQNSVIGLGNVAIQSNINTFGAFAMAGHGAYAKVEGFCMLTVMSMSMTMPTFVSQNLGAHRFDRAKKGAVFGILTGMATSAIIGVLIYNWAPNLLHFFVDTPESIVFGITHARIVSRFYVLLAFSHCAAGVLRGCGKSTVPMVVMLAFWCVVRTIYVTVILKFIPEFAMISWAYPLTWSLSCIVFLIYLIRMDWEKAVDIF